MRAIAPALLLVLSSLPLVAAGPVDATDCDDKDPRVAASEGCYAFVFDPETGTYAACSVYQHQQSDLDFRAAGCSGGGKPGWAGASCSDVRWAQEPDSQTTRRSCGAGAGDASGKGTFASCSSTASSSPARNVTWHECFLTGITAGAGEENGDPAASAGADLDGDGDSDASTGCTSRNITTKEPTKLEIPNLRCGAGSGGAGGDGAPGCEIAIDEEGSYRCSGGDADGDGAPDGSVVCSARKPEPRWPWQTSGRCAGGPRAVVLNAGFYCERELPAPGGPTTKGCGGDAGASSRNGSYPFDPDVRDNGASLQCSLNLTGGSSSDPDAGCGDELSAGSGDLDGDGASDAACRAEGNVTPRQKSWLPSNFRCAAGPDADGDGAPDTTVGCEANDGIAIDHEGVQRCKWFVPDMDSDGGATSGDVEANARNISLQGVLRADLGGLEDGSFRCAPETTPGSAESGVPACTSTAKWKIYTPLPNAFSVGRCDGGTSGAWASCEWDGPAGPGSAAHYGAPPTHSNVVVADMDRDGRPDLFVYENGGAASVFANAGGCFVSAGAKPGQVPAARSCLA